MGLIQAPIAVLSSIRRRAARLLRRSGSDDHETNLSYSSESDPSSPHFLTVSIEQPVKGFFCTLKAIGKVDLPPKAVFDILTSSENPTDVFKAIKRVNYRKPISDDGKGKKKTEVEHVGVWRFGPIKGEFVVRMLVTQDRNRWVLVLATCASAERRVARLARSDCLSNSPTRSLAHISVLQGVYQVQAAEELADEGLFRRVAD